MQERYIRGNNEQHSPIGRRERNIRSARNTHNKTMGDCIAEPQWGRIVDKEFQDVFPDIEGADPKVYPEQHEREKKLDKRRDFGHKWPT